MHLTIQEKEILVREGADIRRRRERLKVSGRALAKLAFVDATELSRIERGVINASIVAYLRIDTVLERLEKRRRRS